MVGVTIFQIFRTCHQKLRMNSWIHVSMLSSSQFLKNVFLFRRPIIRTLSTSSVNLVTSTSSHECKNGDSVMPIVTSSEVLPDSSITALKSDFESMNSRELAKVARNAAASRIIDIQLWSAISAQCAYLADLLSARQAMVSGKDGMLSENLSKNGTTSEKNSLPRGKMRFFDAIGILDSMHSVGMTDSALCLSLSSTLNSQVYLMSPTHMCNLVKIYNHARVRPQSLFATILRAMMKGASSMYSEELAMCLQCLSTFDMSNDEVNKQFVRVLVQNINILKFKDLCKIVASLHFLKIDHFQLVGILDEKAKFECKTMPTQEVLDTLVEIKNADISWSPYEQLIFDEFSSRIANMHHAEDVDELAEPFGCCNFLKVHNILPNNFLVALSRWSRAAVYRPPTRSYKRPLAADLVQLHDIMRERGLENTEHLQKALLHFVTTDGGNNRSWSQKIFPVKYQKGRKYYELDDCMKPLLVKEKKARLRRRREALKLLVANANHDISNCSSNDSSDDQNAPRNDINSIDNFHTNDACSDKDHPSRKIFKRAVKILRKSNLRSKSEFEADLPKAPNLLSTLLSKKVKKSTPMYARRASYKLKESVSLEPRVGRHKELGTAHEGPIPNRIQPLNRPVGQRLLWPREKYVSLTQLR